MERLGMSRGWLPRHLGHSIGDMDLSIAAARLHHDLAFGTHNLPEFQFQDLAGVQLYQPS